MTGNDNENNVCKKKKKKKNIYIYIFCSILGLIQFKPIVLRTAKNSCMIIII